MSAAIAMAPSPAPHDRPSYADMSSATNAPAGTSSPPVPRTVATSNAHHQTPSAPRSRSRSPTRTALPQAKSSPPSALRNVSSSSNPKIVVKKEPGSPEIPTTRHRPRKLDLSKNTLTGSGAATARPALGGREGLGIQEVGLACLSPGFVTQDPVMKAHLQQSMDVREKQRRIIEARLQQQSAKGDGPDTGKDKDPLSQFAAKTPGMSRRNKAPPGLSIVAPSHEQFANERVIQSAPLGHTFTGRHHPHPLTRQVANQPSNLSSTSHIHHVPATQTANRLPPIADVFANQGLQLHGEANNRPSYPGPSHAPLPSPSHPPPTAFAQPPPSGRPREYKSAEEAQHDLSGGRPELLPKLVHYTGHQPPTPPSPRNGSAMHDGSQSSSKRRTRAEYEEGGSPPLGHGPAATRRGPFGAGRDSPETQRQKREEFLRLCERAWDLFHS
ncbi:hypothetical protein F5Y16DRAFT_294916 [Xylariaceae sp. FL0255]|nr:hypothetical protein F5Y16DRAFT_294916 [Xylariaceae sp. FL0255]